MVLIRLTLIQNLPNLGRVINEQLNGGKNLNHFMISMLSSSYQFMQRKLSMKTIHLGVGLATVLSCLSGISYGACTVSSIQGGTIGVGTSNDKLLSSKPTESTVGVAGSFIVDGCKDYTLSVAAPTYTTGINPALSSKLSEIYNSSNGTGTVIADSINKTFKFNNNTPKTYSAHMSVTASNPLLPGSYGYNVTVTITRL